MEIGIISKHILKDIANFIRKRKGSADEIKPVDMAAELESIPTFEDGKQAEYDRFWDALQHNGDGTADYRYMFFYWDDEAYNPKYPIYSTKASMLSCYTNARILDTKVDIDVSKTTTATGFFNYCTVMHTVRKVIISEKTKFDGFINCMELVNITFEGVIGCDGINLQQSTKLSRDSIVNIIGCLSTTTSGLSITLSKTAVNNAFTTEEWTALEQTRPNWTISLV